MKLIPLNAIIRNQLGKEATKKLRREHYIPALLYKGGKKNIALKVLYKDFLKSVHTRAGENVILDLKIKEEAGKDSKTSATAIIKELQHHFTKGEVTHIDFQEISLKEAITVKVPIEIKGEAKGIKEGGIVEHLLWELEIQCLPTEIPEKIPLSVTELNIGDTLLVKDLKVPAGVKVLSEADKPVVSVAVPKAEVVEEVPPEEAMAEPEVIKQKKPEEEAAEGAEEKPAAEAKAEKKEKEPEKKEK